MMKKLTFLLIVLTGTLFLTAYAQTGKVEKAKCVLNPTQGNKVTGTIMFTKVDDGVKVTAKVSGLTKGLHGFHIHEFGDCSAPDGNSAGGHYNPATKPHGAPVDHNRHAGDMGNIEADESGNGYVEYVDHAMTLEGESSIVGKAVIVHAGADDFKTQPTGNAGARVACGVIEAL